MEYRVENSIEHPNLELLAGKKGIIVSKYNGTQLHLYFAYTATYKLIHGTAFEKSLNWTIPGPFTCHVRFQDWFSSLVRDFPGRNIYSVSHWCAVGPDRIKNIGAMIVES